MTSKIRSLSLPLVLVALFATTPVKPSGPDRRFIAILSALDCGAICLSEQIKSPENRQNVLNSAGIVATNLLLKSIPALRGTLPVYSLRFIGSNLGEMRDLFRAVKNRNTGEYLRSRSKRDIAAFVLKCLLVTAPTTLHANKKINHLIESVSPGPVEEDEFASNWNVDNESLINELANTIRALRLPNPNDASLTLPPENYDGIGTISFDKTGKNITKLALLSHAIQSKQISSQQLGYFLRLCRVNTNNRDQVVKALRLFTDPRVHWIILNSDHKVAFNYSDDFRSLPDELQYQ